MRPSWFYFVARIGLWFLSIILIPTCWLYSIGRRKKCPPITNSLLLYSAKKLAHLIRTRQTTCEEIMRAYVEHAENVNKITNAIVEQRFQNALQEAIEVDKKLKESTKSVAEMETETPLLGVPVTVKESIMVEGMSCNVGCGEPDVSIKGTKDAFSVQQIKKAGGIILCVTNTPEYCMFWETYNNITGVTRNPYDTRRTVGGSSGGEAALISSGASVVGLGSDLAGSLRLPAFFTGIFSHKPSPHLVSIDGFLPKCHDDRYSDYIVQGTLTRYAEDLPLMMSVISNLEDRHHFTDSDKVSIADLKFYYMEKEYQSFMATNVDSGVLNAMKSFIDYLKSEHKVNVQKVHIQDMCHSFTRSLQVLIVLDKVECQFVDEDLNFTNFWNIFFKFITFRSKTTLPLIMYGIAKKIYLLFKKKFDNNNVFKENEALKNDFQNLLGDNGILLYPTWTGPAHYHYAMFYKMINFGYCSIFNLLGLPVTQVPSGFTSNGLPIGFQVVANVNNDRLTLAVATEAEKYFGGWTPPRVSTVVTT